MYGRIHDVLANVFGVSLITMVGSFMVATVLSFYGYVQYPYTLLTTDPDYMHLSIVAPTLWSTIMFFLFVAAIAMVATYLTYKMGQKIRKSVKKGRR